MERKKETKKERKGRREEEVSKNKKIKGAGKVKWKDA